MFLIHVLVFFHEFNCKLYKSLTPCSLDDLKDLEYCRVRVKGTFDHSKEVYIGPRSLMKSEEERGGGLMSTGGNSGYHVVTPFHVVDSE